MGLVATKEEVFQRVLVERATGEETTDELRQMCIDAGMFDDDPGLNRAREKYMNQEIHRLARQDGWVDRDGEPLELFNVVRKDPGTGKKANLWVNLKLATFDDCVYLVKDRLAKSEYFHSEARRIYDHGRKVHGRKFQKLFQFD